MLFQPIAADDVAAAVARTAAGPPTKDILEVAGPERFRFDELVEVSLRAHGDTRPVVADPHARYFGAELGERTLVPDDGAQLGSIRFEDWLRRSADVRPRPRAVHLVPPPHRPRLTHVLPDVRGGKRVRVQRVALGHVEQNPTVAVRGSPRSG